MNSSSISNIRATLQKMKPSWQRLLFWGILASWLTFQLYQSLSSTSELAFVGMRGEDDEGFHSALRVFSKLIADGRWNQLFDFQPCGYGWIFWATSYVFSLPGYFLSTRYGVDWLLIASMSWMSLSFFLGSLYQLNRIYKILGVPKDSALILTLLPLTVGYFWYGSLKWHPLAANLFFALAAITHVLSLERVNYKALFILAGLGALSASYRMFCLLLAPSLFFSVIYLLIIAKEPVTRTVRKSIFFVLTYTFIFLLFSYPNLFKEHSLHEVLYQIGRIREAGKLTTNAGFRPEFEDLGHRLYRIWLYGYWGWVATAGWALATGYFLLGLKKNALQDKSSSLVLIIMGAPLLGFVFNIFIAKGDPGYATNHFFPLFFLLLIPFYRFQKLQPRYGYSLLASMLVLNTGSISNFSTTYRDTMARWHDTRAESKELRDFVLPLLKDRPPAKFLADYQAQPIVNSDFGDNVTYASFGDNLSDYCNHPSAVEFLVIANTSTVGMPDAEFETLFEERLTSARQVSEAIRAQGLIDTQTTYEGYRFSRSEIRRLRAEQRFCLGDFETIKKTSTLTLYRRKQI